MNNLGDQTRLHLSLEGFDVVTLTNSETKLAAGDKIKIQPNNALYFDANGNRIGIRRKVMNQFINAKENLVIEAIDGMLKHSGGQLARLDGYPHIKVVVRNDWDKKSRGAHIRVGLWS